MTKQEAFDIVAKHLLTQGAKSNGARTCMYRGENGMKCAVGALIPDEKYSSSSILLEEGHDARMCVELQFVRDAYPPQEWQERLEALAKTEGLEFHLQAYRGES